MKPLLTFAQPPLAIAPAVRTAAPLLLAVLGVAFASRPAPCQFPGVTLYGTPTAGCAGQATIGVNSAPALGNSTFAITCQGAFALAPGLLILSTAHQVPPVLFWTANVWVDTHSAAAFFVNMSLAGNAAITQPIPAQPSLIGISWYAQYGWVEPGPGCPAGSSVLAATQALQFTVQPVSDPGEPNNNSGQATPIASGSTLSRLIWPSGDEDWYTFSFATGRRIATVGMTPPVGRNYDLELRDATSALAVSAQGGSTPESISQCLGPGTYYLRVLGAAGASDPVNAYGLTFNLATYTPAPPQTTTANNAAVFTSSAWHPVLRNSSFQGPPGPCDETVTIAITGAFTLTCTSATAEIVWSADNLPFTQILASTALFGGPGNFSLTATFTAHPGRVYDFGLYLSGATGFCPVTVNSGTMTVTRR